MAFDTPALSADDNINRHVAAALGWRKEGVDSFRFGQWVAPDGTYHQHLPKWAYYVDVAMSLLDPKVRIDITYHDGLWYVVIDTKFPSEPFDDERVFDDIHLAAAVCLAWLNWQGKLDGT